MKAKSLWRIQVLLKSGLLPAFGHGSSTCTVLKKGAMPSPRVLLFNIYYFYYAVTLAFQQVWLERSGLALSPVAQNPEPRTMFSWNPGSIQDQESFVILNVLWILSSRGVLFVIVRDPYIVITVLKVLIIGNTGFTCSFLIFQWQNLQAWCPYSFLSFPPKVSYLDRGSLWLDARSWLFKPPEMQ